MRSRHPLQIGERQDRVLVLQTEGVELVFVPQMHFEVADSSSIRGGGRRARPRALVWLGIRPWREGERQWREEESPWRESRESKHRCVLSVPLGRSGFFSSHVLCVWIPFLWNGRLCIIPNSRSPFLSCKSYSREISVRILRSKSALVSAWRYIGGAPIGMGEQESAVFTSSLYSMKSAITSSSKARVAESLLSAPGKVWPQCLRHTHCP